MILFSYLLIIYFFIIFFSILIIVFNAETSVYT